MIVPRVLGLDPGSVRIGVAISDQLGMLAHPRETIPATPIAAALARIQEIIRTEEVATVVIGLPLNLDGSDGPAAENIRKFASTLEARCGCPIRFWDERLSTVTAQQNLHAAGRNIRNSRAVIDQAAAQVILQSYLDSITPMF